MVRRRVVLRSAYYEQCSIVFGGHRIPSGKCEYLLECPVYYRFQPFASWSRLFYIIRGVNQESDMRSRIEVALEQVRPALQADGGDARVAQFDEERGAVGIEMMGACRGCPLSQLDFVYAIETLIRREVPEVREIFAV